MKYTFNKHLIDTFNVWKQEFLHIFREPGVLIIFFAATLLYPILYGVIYNNEVLKNIPVAVVDLSHSSLSREYVRALDATPELNISNKCHSLEEAKALFYQHKVHGIVLIPEEFGDNITKGRQARVLGYFDMSSFLYYKTVMTAVSMVSKELGAQIQYSNLVNSGLTEQQAKMAVTPLPYEGKPLFNSGGGFASFLLPGVFILILYQTLMLGINMLAGVDWEDNRIRRLIPVYQQRLGTLGIVFGKGLCYFTLYAVFSFFVLGFVPNFFNLPHIGNSLDLMLFMIPFLLSTIFLAMTLSLFMRNMESAFLLLLFSTMPLLFLAGASWPQTNIPEFWKFVSYLFPSTHGIQGYIRINTMAANLNEVSKEYFILWLETGIYFLTACWVYRRLLRKVDKN